MGLLDSALGYFGAKSAAKEAERDRKLLRDHAEKLGGVTFNPFATNFGGAGVSFGPNGANFNMGQFGDINSIFQNLSQIGTQQGFGQQQQATADLQGAGNEGLANAMAALAAGGASGLAQNGFQRALQQQLFGQAGQLAGQTDFSQLRDETLGTLRAQAAPQEQRAFAGLQDNLFATGRLGSSGGALQTEAFAKGLGEADLSRQLAATNVAQQQQQQNASIANMFGGLGSGLAGLEGQLMQDAFGRFGQTAGLAADLNQMRFGRGTQTFQQGLQSLGGQQDILQSLLGLGTFGANLGAQQADTRLSALGGAGNLLKASTDIAGKGTIMGGALSQLGSSGFGNMIGGALGKIPGFGGIGSFLSDRRLKENIQYISTDDAGHKWYRWTWNAEAKELGLEDNPTIGVMAQEVQKLAPEAVTVGRDGYLRVDYGVL